MYGATGPKGEPLAAKVVKRVSGSSREQLVVSGLPESPHIVPVLHVEETPGSFVLYMPRATTSLRARMSEPLTLTEALKILGDIARALEILDDAIVHRDLKPENVLLVNGAWALCDFGIARFAEATTSLETHKGSLSAPYAAPEQWRYERATGATDVYAFGVLAHELIAGERPFSGTLDELRDAHLTRVPPGIEGPRKLAWTISECLAKAPQARPTAAALVVRLDSAESEATSKAARALQQAQSALISARATEEARVQAEASEEERRGLLLLAAESGYEALSQELVEFIADSAPDTEVTRKSGIDLTLNNARLTLAPLRPVRKADQPWDVIAQSSVRVAIGSPSRSHSLYFADFESHGRYAWFELGFMNTFNADFDSEPRELPPKEGLLALLPTMASYQLAWGVKRLDPGSPDEFVESWAERFGLAAVNKFPRLSRLPDGNPVRPSAIGRN
ncbi:serine/threonine protein kinase [Leucobacter chromiiresistens]|uniref:Serine/threonine protein kinase n=1 Tax=Leucobacter chromiiresistens TaxID=1079994 RepID=A0A1H1A0Q7_9MICO|nr:serine/threonine protein kinase [Leucobacter chromiiresistens]